MLPRRRWSGPSAPSWPRIPLSPRRIFPARPAVVYLREETQADGTVTRRYTVYFVPRDFDVLVEDTFVTMDAKTGETVAWETCPNG